MSLRRLFAALCAALAVAGGAAAQEGTARLDVAQSQVRDSWEGLRAELHLSRPVPFRVFTLDAPRQLVIDIRDTDWRGASRQAMLNADRATDLRFAPLRPGWSRLTVDLAGPMVVTEAGMAVAPDGEALLRVRLRTATPEEHAAQAGAPSDPGWEALAAVDVSRRARPAYPHRPLVVVLDPGHGGLDPGAERGGLKEADLMLALAREVAAALEAEGMRVVLTRGADVFVPIDARMTIARGAGADVLVSLHADALELDQARGASVYTLTAEATDQASDRMAQRHGQSDLLAGVDLTGQDDTVATVLMNLARLETQPQTERLAAAMVAGLGQAGARVNGKPRREGRLAVLMAADFPSILLEAGFLSNAADRAMLSTAEGRAAIVRGITAALVGWAADEAARAPLIRR